MSRWALLALVAALLLTAYPRLLRRQSHRVAEATTAQIAPQLRDGDLIFHTSLSVQSRAIQLATHSPYSRCGIAYKKGKNWQVFKAVQPVKLTSRVD